MSFLYYSYILIFFIYHDKIFFNIVSLIKKKNMLDSIYSPNNKFVLFVFFNLLDIKIGFFETKSKNISFVNHGFLKWGLKKVFFFGDFCRWLWNFV